MKTIIIYLMLSLAMSNFSFAKPVELSTEAKDIMHGFLSPSGLKALAEVHRYIDTITSVKVETYVDLTEYQITGMLVGGGDIPCGHATLRIQVSLQPEFGFPNLMIKTYQVKLEDKVDLCNSDRFSPASKAPKS